MSVTLRVIVEGGRVVSGVAVVVTVLKAVSISDDNKYTNEIYLSDCDRHDSASSSASAPTAVATTTTASASTTTTRGSSLAGRTILGDGNGLSRDIRAEYTGH